MDTTEFALSKPLRTHKGDVSSLTLREPTARSFVTHGNPFKPIVLADGTRDFDFDEKSAIGFLSDMCGHDQIVLEGLGGNDWFRLRYALASIVFAGVGGQNPTAQSGV